MCMMTLSVDLMSQLSGPVLEESGQMMDALCAQIHNITCDPLTPRYELFLLTNKLILTGINGQFLFILFCPVRFKFTEA